MSASASHFLRSTTPGGPQLHVQSLGDEGAERTLVVVHGYGEHGGRYVARMQAMVEAGWRVLLVDVRGHGRSGGPRGFVARFDDYLSDLDAVFAHFELTPAKTALLAHSHGGLISIRYLQTRPHAVAAAYITSPLLGIAVQAPAWKESLGRLMSRLAPRISLPGEIEADWVCRDPEVVRAYTSDPLNHHIVNARWYTEAVAAMDAAFEGPAPEVPTRLEQAGADKLVSAARSEAWARAKGVPFVMHPEHYHELIFEADGAERVAEARAHFEEHIG